MSEDKIISREGLIAQHEIQSIDLRNTIHKAIEDLDRRIYDIKESFSSLIEMWDALNEDQVVITIESLDQHVLSDEYYEEAILKEQMKSYIEMTQIRAIDEFQHYLKKTSETLHIWTETLRTDVMKLRKLRAER